MVTPKIGQANVAFDAYYDGAPVERSFFRDRPWILFLHGLMGARRNIRAIAKQLSKNAAGHIVVCLDLPGHGDAAFEHSPSGLTIQQCAEHCVSLTTILGSEPRGVIGHSLGGKVALYYMANYGSELGVTIVLDAYPGLLDPSDDRLGVTQVIESAEQVELVGGRRHIVKRLVASGLSEGTAAWLSTNIRLNEMDGSVAWQIDFKLMRAVLTSYCEWDAWPTFERPPTGVNVYLVAAGKSLRWGDAERARLNQLADNIPQFKYHTIENAGHWLHIDAPKQLCEILSQALQESGLSNGGQHGR